MQHPHVSERACVCGLRGGGHLRTRTPASLRSRVGRCEAPAAPAAAPALFGGRTHPRAMHVRRRAHSRSTGTSGSAAPVPDAAESTAEADFTAVTADEEAEAVPQVLAGKTVGVVGGGPGGMLCAAHLARLGASVEVFEQDDPDAGDKSQPPPPLWSISLGPNAWQSLNAAGLKPDLGPKWRFEGSSVKAVGKPDIFWGDWALPQGTVPPEGSTGRAAGSGLTTQHGIVAHITAECERVYGDSVTVTHGVRGVGGRVCEGEVVLDDAAGERTTRQFDLVVGADGVNSTIRQLIQEQDNTFKVHVDTSSVGIISSAVDSPGHPSTFATLETPSGTPFRGTPEGYEGALEGCCFHALLPRGGGPAALSQCAVSVRFGGQEIVLNMSTDAQKFRELGSAEEAEALFVDAYPHLPTAWSRQTAHFIEEKARAEGLRVRSPKFVTCSKLASGRAILLGDAAHAVSPNVGAGGTCALQDSEIFAKACIAADGDLVDAGRRYSAVRLEDVHIVTHTSKRIDDSINFKFHRNVLAWILAIPYRLLMNADDWAIIPGFLKPRLKIIPTFMGCPEFKHLRDYVRWYFVQVVAFFAAVAAAVSWVAWKAFLVFAV